MPRIANPKRDPNRCPSHPGAVLREIVLPEVRATKSAVAAALKISRNQLHLILSEKQPVTPETAVKLEAALADRLACG
jgi:addiction module HigA family antidote